MLSTAISDEWNRVLLMNLWRLLISNGRRCYRHRYCTFTILHTCTLLRLMNHILTPNYEASYCIGLKYFEFDCNYTRREGLTTVTNGYCVYFNGQFLPICDLNIKLGRKDIVT